MKKLFFALAMMLATVTAFLVAPSVKAETTVKLHPIAHTLHLNFKMVRKNG